MTRATRAIAFAAATALASSAAAAGPPSPSPFKFELAAEARSQALCESVPDRMYVKVGRASECVAYFVTKGREDLRHAVIFLDGDASKESYDPAARAKTMIKKHAFMQKWANKLRQRYVEIARVGLDGSSGNHGDRRKPHETIIMNEALNILKARLGLDMVTLAGQSRGSTIAASLLTFGRKDVTCAVLGSGAFELANLDYALVSAKGLKITKAAVAKTTYDPSRHVDAIAHDPGRRIFVLGDPADHTTPFDQQERFTEQLKAAGHHVRLFAIDAGGKADHVAASTTIPMAGACAHGMSDDRIDAATRKQSKTSANEAGLMTR